MGTEKTALRVTVEFHSGYKGEEEPRLVILQNRRIPVERILARKRILDTVTGQVSEEFSCLLEGREARLIVSESGAHHLIFKT